MSAVFSLAVFFAAVGQTYAETYTIPSVPGSSASQQLDPAPIGVSLEFFTFPAYMQDVDSTSTCLANLGNAMGAAPPVRIGGTTQDRGTYDSSLATAVSYTVASPTDAPDSLTFGPQFMTLAAELEGEVTIGLNRRLNNIDNTIAAAQVAVDTIDNLYAIELGNEPEFYSSSDPIATTGSWTPALDAASQISWQEQVTSALDTSNLIEAGVFLQPPTWSTAELAPKEGSAASAVHSFSGHSYPQSACNGASTNLGTLMSHSDIVSYTSQYRAEANAAAAISKPYVLGETNSATCGGGGISPTFGAALWIVDYVMQALIVGAQRLYFHQGTIGDCQYCWWGRFDMGAPYYGAYFVAEALGGADKVQMIDSGTDAYAVYAIYKNNALVRVLMYNSNMYSSGTRSSESFTLSGLSVSGTVTAKRLTAASANSRQDEGQNPTVGGQTFANGTCALQGTQQIETVTVSGGSATFTLAASEALLVSV